MREHKVDLSDPIVAGIALGKRLDKGSSSGGGYRLVGAPESAPQPGKVVVLGVEIPASSKVQAFG